MYFFFSFGKINTLPASFSPACHFLDVFKSSFHPSIFQQHKSKMSTYLVPEPSAILFLSNQISVISSILFRVWMSNLRTRRLVKSELPHSEFLAFTPKEKLVVANCTIPLLQALMEKKKMFFLKTIKERNNPGKTSKTQQFNIRFIL